MSLYRGLNRYHYVQPVVSSVSPLLVIALLGCFALILIQIWSVF